MGPRDFDGPPPHDIRGWGAPPPPPPMFGGGPGYRPGFYGFGPGFGPGPGGPMWGHRPHWRMVPLIAGSYSHRSSSGVVVVTKLNVFGDLISYIHGKKLLLAENKRNINKKNQLKKGAILKGELIGMMNYVSGSFKSIGEGLKLTYIDEKVKNKVISKEYGKYLKSDLNLQIKQKHCYRYGLIDENDFLAIAINELKEQEKCIKLMYEKKDISVMEYRAGMDYIKKSILACSNARARHESEDEIIKNNTRKK